MEEAGSEVMRSVITLLSYWQVGAGLLVVLVLIQVSRYGGNGASPFCRAGPAHLLKAILTGGVGDRVAGPAG
mgnify:CR=1 FL=1